MGDARVIYCTQCGASLPLDRLVGSTVSCEGCGCQCQVAAELLQQLAQYQADVRSQVKQAGVQQQSIATLNYYYGGRGARRGFPIWLAIVGPMPLMLLIPLAMGLAQSAGFSSLGLAAAVFIWIVAAAITVGLLAWYYSGKRRQVAGLAVPRSRVACPSCGASHEFDAGSWVDKCPYCGVAMAPTPAVMTEVAASLCAEQRRLEMAQWQAERQMMRFAGRTSSSSVPILWGLVATLALILSGLAVYATVQCAQNQCITMDVELLANVHLMAMLFWWGATLLLPGLLAAVAINESHSARQRQAAASQLATALAGTASRAVGTLVDWLDTYWCAPYPATHVPYGFDHQHVIGRVHGFPSLIDVSPTPFTSKYAPYGSRIEILLAVHWPEHSQTLAASELTQPDFTLDVTSAGIRARANAAFIKRIQEQPETTITLAQVAAGLAIAALNRGGAPPPAVAEA